MNINGHNYYLKQDVKLEPLFNRWYAYPLLIAPATAAMNIANSHVKIMKSYVSAPEVHAAACKNPAMLGGPFIDYDGKRVNEIKTLMDTTVKEQSHMIEFAGAIKSMSDILTSEARGYSVEPLYEKVPECLKGLVELNYDLNNQPSFRLIEGLLYKTRYYNPASQSVTVSLLDGDDRAFAYSTPRIGSENELHLNRPFNDEGLATFVKMREIPQKFATIKEQLGVDDKDDELLASFLTDEAPVKRPEYDGEQVRIRYFGHACVLVETKDVRILMDPVVSYDIQTDFPRYTYLDLPDTIDYVLVTHSHADHLLFETLLQLRHKIKNVVVPRNSGALEDPSLKSILHHVGFESVIEVNDMDTFAVAGGSVTALPFLGEHADLNIRSKSGYAIQLLGKSILCVADSNNLDSRMYERVHEVIGNVDVLFIGMECDGAPLTWIYGSLLTKPVDRKMDQSRRLSGSDYQRAWNMVQQLKCKQVYVYAMGQEPWLCFLTSIKYTEQSKPIVESNKLVAACREAGLESERLYGCKQILL
jgi:L-ascorbate metabolism protein UlaG (beta-lactamase superfamily)